MKNLLLILLLAFLSVLNNNSNSQDLLWAKSLGGTINDYVGSMAVDSEGNVYSAGLFAGTVDFDPGVAMYNLTSSYYYDFFIWKLDAFGNFLWAKQIGGTFNSGINFVAIDASGNIYLTGSFSGTMDFDPGAGTYNLTAGSVLNMFIVKLNSSGNFIWAKQLGGIGIADGYSIAFDADANVCSTGYFQDVADFDPGPGVYNLTALASDVFVSKLDSSGNFIWAKQIVGSDYAGSTGKFISINGNGNIYITGDFQGAVDFDPGLGTFSMNSMMYSDIFVAKWDSTGNFVWAKQMTTTDFTFDLSSAMDSGGNIYTTGYFQGTIDLDPGPGTYDLTTAGGNYDYDIFISKLDSSGNFIWGKQIGSTTSWDWGASVAVDASGNVYTTGYFSGVVDFDPDSGVYNLSATGERDIFVSKLNDSGSFVWARQMGGSGFNGGVAVALDISANVYATGWFSDSADFDPGAGTYTLNSVGGYDIFIVKLTDFPLAINPSTDETNNAALIYPNPASGNFLITSDNKIFGTVQLFNLLGEKVFEETISNELKKEITLRDISPGIYFVKVIDGEKEHTQKLIVQ